MIVQSRNSSVGVAFVGVAFCGVLIRPFMHVEGPAIGLAHLQLDSRAF